MNIQVALLEGFQLLKVSSSLVQFTLSKWMLIVQTVFILKVYLIK